ncbi:putative Lupus La protein-like protein A [Hypsibius exemplaris]|uniref:Lupus La protein-like protein A n=1 Tax=Hypsibius exemplaris TaxID=2072580 RepID=A0A1W0WCC7_HYPEX|nr:putative Lupus La protein-like protein A [Hypsibius exemplaris]
MSAEVKTIPPAEKEVSADSTVIKAVPTAAAAANGQKTEVKLKPDQAARVDEIMKRIAEQVEFYLGDFNLNRDKFFRELVQNGEGWVPLDAILKCNRVKKFTSNPDDIVNSLKKFSELELDETNTKIKRKTAFLEDSEEARADRDPRTVYVKRFLKTATIDAMQDYFRKFGPIDGIVLNKFQEGDAKLKGKFKGSVHCIFKNKPDAEAFLAASVESTMFDSKEMQRAWKTVHAVEREQRLENKKVEIEESKIPGSVLHLSCQRQINYVPLREYFEKLSPVRFLDHQRGQREARVRFQAGVAKEVLENILSHNNNKIVIDGIVYKGRVLEGKEEKAYFDTYWDTFLESKNNRILRNMRGDLKQQFKFNGPKPVDKNGKKPDTAKPAAAAEEDVKADSPTKKRPVEEDTEPEATSKKTKAEEEDVKSA